MKAALLLALGMATASPDPAQRWWSVRMWAEAPTNATVFVATPFPTGRALHPGENAPGSFFALIGMNSGWRLDVSRVPMSSDAGRITITPACDALFDGWHTEDGIPAAGTPDTYYNRQPRTIRQISIGTRYLGPFGICKPNNDIPSTPDQPWMQELLYPANN